MSNKSNYPVLLDAFVGRGEALEHLGELVAAGRRLVTVVGAPGMGKTRLALEFARSQQDHFERCGGLFFCDLSAARSTEDVLGSVAHALNVSLEGAGDSANAATRLGLALALRGEVLLVLDNFEQVAASAAHTVARWAQLAPHTTQLVTSRSRLRVRSEAVLALAPLGQDDAIALYCERAAEVGDGDQRERDVVLEIVDELDCIPLAIELASAQTLLFSDEEIRDRIGDRFRLLKERRRDARGRHSTLRRAIEWSWELLGESERHTLAQCAVFQGSFGHAALEAVVVLDDPAESATDCLFALVERSLLLRQDEGGQSRFRAFASIRAFAAEQLDAMGTHEGARDRHARFVLGAVEPQIDQFDGTRGVAAQQSVRREIDELLAIVRHFRTSNPALAARAGLAADAVLRRGGPSQLRREVLSAALRSADSPWRLRLLHAQAVLHLDEGDPAGCLECIAKLDHAELPPPLSVDVALIRAQALLRFDRSREACSVLEAALEMCVAHQLARPEAYCRAYLGGIKSAQGARAESEAQLEQALVLARQCHLMSCEKLIWRYRAVAAYDRGALGECCECFGRAVTAAQQVGPPHDEAQLRGLLAAYLVELGDEARAQEEADRALALARGLGDRRTQIIVASNWGAMLLNLNRLDEANRYIPETLRWVETLAEPGHESVIRGNLSILAYLRNDVGEALRQIRAALALISSASLYHAYAAGYLAAYEAAAGQLEPSQRTFEQALTFLRSSNAPALCAKITVLQAIAEATTARQAYGAGQTASGDERLRAGERILEEFLLSSGGHPPPALEVLEVRMVRHAIALAYAARDSGTTPATLHPDSVAALPPPQADADSTTDALVLRIGPEARWFCRGDTPPTHISRRRALRLILHELSRRHEQAPGMGLSVYEIFEVGWPGENAYPTSQAMRVYNAVRRLRAMGLEGALVTWEDGYLIDPSVVIIRN